MADEADIANNIMDRDTGIGIQSVLAAVHGQGQEFCEDCECKIPEERRKAYPAATRCVPCQEEFDKTTRLYGR